MPIQISQPGELQTFTQKPQSSDPIIGIDLGTTHSLVAAVVDGKTQVFNTSTHGHLLPSVIRLENGQITVGVEAKKARDATKTVYSIKRLLGKNLEDLKGFSGVLPYDVMQTESGAQIKIDGKNYSPTEISSWILLELKKAAEAALGCPVRRAVITVPAYFNDTQRQATRTAGRLAGLDVLRIINEPTAASLAYGLNQKNQGLIAVYDLGGGTFDISILKLHDGIFEVLSTAGDTQLGGDDFDQAIATVVASEIQAETGAAPQFDSELWSALLVAAERTKITLSTHDTAVFEITAPFPYQRTWTRQELNALLTPILERTRIPCLQALKDAHLTPEDLSDVLLVGGPSRLQIVQDQVHSIFGKKPNTSMHPDEVVAEGAAIQADILAGNRQDLLLLDVVPLSLGLETYGGLMSPLIARNTRIPAVAREGFTTFVDHQTGVDIHVLQGERERAEDNRSLAKFRLQGIQPLPAGLPRIEVTFLIDADGILQVSAKDLKTGREQSIEVKPSHGLTDAEVERMLLERMENQKNDFVFRSLVDARNGATPVLKAVEKNLSLAVKILPEADVQGIQTALNRLKQVVTENDPQVILEATAQLNRITVNLAGLLVKEEINSHG